MNPAWSLDCTSRPIPRAYKTRNWPDDNEAFRRCGADGLLHLLVDTEPASATGSSDPAKGIKVEGEGEWNARKQGGSKRRVWRKTYIGLDQKTLETRAAEVTTSDAGGAAVRPELPDRILRTSRRVD